MKKMRKVIWIVYEMKWVWVLLKFIQSIEVEISNKFDATVMIWYSNWQRCSLVYLDLLQKQIRFTFFKNCMHRNCEMNP